METYQNAGDGFPHAKIWAFTCIKDQFVVIREDGSVLWGDLVKVNGANGLHCEILKSPTEMAVNQAK